MTISVVIEKRATVIEGTAHSILGRIVDPTITLAIWRRSLAPDIQQAADAACKASLACADAFQEFDKSEEDRFYADLTGQTSALIGPVAGDLIALAKIFAGVCEASPVTVRLETVADDGCRRFHYDNVALRLVIAYRGAGTQWVCPEFADIAYAQQADYNGPLNEIGTGDVAMFRGKRSNSAGMTLHRSPPRRAGAPVRLVGVIDCITGERRAAL